MRKTIREKEPVRPSANCVHQCAKRAGGKGGQTVSARPKIPDDLDWIVMKCLEKDRTRRYETANGLAADLKRHLDNEPVTARSPSTGYRFHKAWRRNKLVFSASAAVMAALLVGMVAALWQAGVAESSLYVTRLTAAHYELTTEPSHIREAELLLKACRSVMRDWEWRYLWQLTRSSALVTLTNRPMRGWSVSFSPDGTRLAVGWWDGHVDLWDVPGRRLLRALTDREYPYPYFGRVAFSPVRNLLAATSEPKVVTLYDLDSGRESILWRAPGQGAWEVRDLAFSQDGSKMVIYAGSTVERGDEVVIGFVIPIHDHRVPDLEICGLSRLPILPKLRLARQFHRQFGHPALPIRWLHRVWP
jgi:hypothetical protein